MGHARPLWRPERVPGAFGELPDGDRWLFRMKSLLAWLWCGGLAWVTLKLLKLRFLGNPPRKQGKTGVRSSPR